MLYLTEVQCELHMIQMFLNDESINHSAAILYFFALLEFVNH